MDDKADTFNKADAFRKRFLQQSLGQSLTIRGEYTTLLNALTDEDVKKLIDGNIYFARTSSPSAIIQLTNTPACNILRLITFEANYQSLFSADQVVGIFLHEIGHAFNPDKLKMEGEFAADNFAKSKGYAQHIISGLRHGLELKLIGFEENSINERINKLTEKA